jgi:hypothetical protein
MSDRYFEGDEIQVEGSEALTCYRWGDRLVDHWFCRSCGVYTFHNPTAAPDRYRVNLGCIESIDASSLTIDVVDGRAF